MRARNVGSNGDDGVKPIIGSKIEKLDWKIS